MFVWKEVKTWAKTKGYKTDRKKLDKEEGEQVAYHYTWSMIEDENICGEATSVSKVATAIFNHMTKDVHVEYQKTYQENKEYEQFTVSDYGS